MANETQGTKATRRAFLGSMTALTAASYSRILGANDRIGIGFIGFGLIGKQHVYDFRESFPDVDRIGMCDVYKPRLEEGLAYMQGGPNAKGYTDFRKMYENKDIDGIVVSTPDHWHALLTIMACAAGKDVYVEKPLTVFNDEGKWMLQAKDKYKRIVVVGTQRDHSPRHQVAKETIESGVLGKIQMAALGGSYRNLYPGFGRTPVEQPPADLDYEMWLGPAPHKPYQNHRALYHFRWFMDYSGGQITNSLSHRISAFLLVTGQKAPTKVVCFGGRYTLEDDGNTPDIQNAIIQFPDYPMTIGVRECSAYRAVPKAVIMGQKGTLDLRTNEIIPEPKGDPQRYVPPFQGHPIGGIVYGPRETTPWTEAREPDNTRASEHSNFYANKRDWIDCMRSRRQPFVNLERGHQTATICNLATMSMQLGGRTIQWDPDKQEVIGDSEAAALCRRPYTPPWDAVLRSIVEV
jgi:predicted dehydrogenase